MYINREPQKSQTSNYLIRKIHRLIGQGNYQEAIELCEKNLAKAAPAEKDKISAILLKVKCSKALKQRDIHLLSKIEKIIKNELETHPDSNNVNFNKKNFIMLIKEHATILFNRKKFDDLEKLFDSSNDDIRFAADGPFAYINKEIDDISNEFENKKITSTSNYIRILDLLYSKLYYGTLTVEEIKNSTITEFMKDILILAYHDKNHSKYLDTYKRECKRKYADSPSQLKELNKLFNRMGNNHYFNIESYNEILGASIKKNFKNQTVEPESVQPKQEEKQVLKPQQQVVEPKKQKVESKYVTCVGVKTNNRYTESNYNQIKTVTPNQQVLQIKNMFPKEVEIIGKYLYCNMNNPETVKQAIKAWDNFEILIEKPVTDQQAIDNMTKKIGIFEKAGLMQEHKPKEINNKQMKKTQ